MYLPERHGQPARGQNDKVLVYLSSLAFAFLRAEIDAKKRKG
jgi:hypothetical protein